MSTIAFLFPGQGSQSVGMIGEFQKQVPESRKWFKLWDPILGISTESWFNQLSEQDLKNTNTAQMAISIFSLTMAKVLEEKSIYPTFLAGHSLGELIALCYAQVWSLSDFYRIVEKRGQLMYEAFNKLEQQGIYTGMLAVLGLDLLTIQQVLQEEKTDQVYIGNYNAPMQYVLSGVKEQLNQLELALKEKGARRLIPLSVQGAMHSPFLEPIAEQWGDFLKEIPFHKPCYPIYSNCLGRLYQPEDDMRNIIKKHVFNPVQWLAIEQSILENLSEDARIYECGPGKVLSGLWMAVSKKPCLPLSKSENFSQLSLEGGL